MKKIEEVNDYWKETISKSIPQLSINTVIFRFHQQQLQFAAVQVASGSLWYIPGGYVYQDESIDDAAWRNLYEQTHLDHLVLNQIASFGSNARRMLTNTEDIDQLNMPAKIHEWINQRFITIAYYSVISDTQSAIKCNPLYNKAKWLNIDQHQELAMDHNEIVMEAQKVLARDLLSRPLLLSFLPGSFTIPDLQRLYEAILGRSVDRGNFRKRILKSNILTKTGKVKANTGQRPPELYKLNKESYLNSLTEDVKLGF